MTIVSAENLTWRTEDQSVLTATVTFEDDRIWPMCVHENYGTKDGDELWTRALDGDFGPIADYVDSDSLLTPEEKRLRMPDLEKWRVDTIIDLEPGLRDKINAAIDKWSEPKRTISKNKLASVARFSRTDTLFDDVVADPEVGKTPEDIDIMWEAAVALD